MTLLAEPSLDTKAVAAPAALRVEPFPVPQNVPLKTWPWTQQELRTPNQPHWLRVYRTALPAYKAVHKARARISLVNLETNCLHHGMPPLAGESDSERLARWIAGLDRAVTGLPKEIGQLGGVSPRMGTHFDGMGDVLELVRINSAYLQIDPALSDGYHTNRGRLDGDIKSGTARLMCQPPAYGVYADSSLFHSGPAAATVDGTPLEGPHLPEAGKVPMGRVRVFARWAVPLFADDLG